MTITDDDRAWLQRAVELADANAVAGGRPFGAVLVSNNILVAEAVNTMHRDHDPTAHAEINALRAGARALQRNVLDGCLVYASGQPCPMCLASMRMCGITRVMHAFSNADAEPWGLSTAAVYADLARDPALQTMPCMHVPLASPGSGNAGLYQRWHAAQHRPDA